MTKTKQVPSKQKAENQAAKYKANIVKKLTRNQGNAPLNNEIPC